MSETLESTTAQIATEPKPYLFQWNSANFRLLGPFSGVNTAITVQTILDSAGQSARWGVLHFDLKNGAYQPKLRNADGESIDPASVNIDHGPAYFIMRWRAASIINKVVDVESSFEFRGPFTSAAHARKVGRGEQEALGDDPCWELMMLDTKIIVQPVSPIAVNLSGSRTFLMCEYHERLVVRRTVRPLLGVRFPE